MDGCYEVFQEGKAVGTVEVRREGLYYRFSCRCKPEGGEMMRLWMICGEEETDLGLCIPMDGIFGTEKRIPAKLRAPGQPSFCLYHKDDIFRGRFIPLSPEEPFQYLHRLENAFLERRGRQVGIVLR